MKNKDQSVAVDTNPTIYEYLCFGYGVYSYTKRMMDLAVKKAWKGMPMVDYNRPGGMQRLEGMLDQRMNAILDEWQEDMGHSARKIGYAHGAILIGGIIGAGILGALFSS